MIKNRNMFMQVILYLITFTLYGIYWYYVTSKEMIEHKNLDGSAGIRTVLLFIPIVNFYSYWKHSQGVSALTDGRYPAILMFVLWILFSPLVWLMTQLELNKAATA